MNYQEALSYLYENVPMFQQVGKSAYKEGLETTCYLDNYFGNPHRSFKTIHVAGTNGKGSCSHTLAAIFQSAGYKTGLYTSPHMLDFRERMRVNGKEASKEYVINFLTEHRVLIDEVAPSFFELTTIMAFNYFAQQEVEVAIIEVGMGGRLDCTNIIHPTLSIITNISLDHTQFLGNTLEKIALEKAGVMKKGVPVIIGETTQDTKTIFLQKAKEVNTPIIFAEEEKLLVTFSVASDEGWIYQSKDYKNLYGELGGNYQYRNTNTLLSAIRELIRQGYLLTEKSVRNGFAHVVELTGIKGRWQKISENPLVVCDTGHNVSGISFITEQLKQQKYKKLHIVLGMVNDKDITQVLSLLPKNAIYYFTKASIPRALSEDHLSKIGVKIGLYGKTYSSVKEAFNAAKTNAEPDDMIFVGGSTFIVADLLSTLEEQQ